MQISPQKFICPSEHKHRPGPPSMAGIPHKYDLLPYSTTLSTPSSSSNPLPLNYTHHRPSKREYVGSSDVEDASPPRKYRNRRTREWLDSSDLGFSSDVDEEEDAQPTFGDTEDVLRRRTRIAAGGVETMESILSSQASQENSTSKFHRILNVAIMDGLDSIDFSYFLSRLSMVC
jgi:hypothetical protein